MGCQETSLKLHSSLQWRWWSPGPWNQGCCQKRRKAAFPKVSGLTSSTEVFGKIFWVLRSDGPWLGIKVETQTHHHITVFWPIDFEYGPLYGVLVRPRVLSPSLEWNAKQYGEDLMIPLRSNPDSPLKLVPIPAHQLSLFLYHHYTPQNIYTSQMFKLDWTTINSNVYRLIDPFHLFRVGKLIADWHEVATANQKINCNALLCKFPATNMGLGLESIYIYICTSLQISWAKEGRFNSNVDQEKDTSMECIHQGKKSALELAIYIYMCIYIVNHTHLQRHVTKQSLSRNNHIKCFHKISLEHKSASSALILLTSNLGSRFGSGSWPLSFVFGLGSHLLAFGSKTQDRLRDRYRSWMNIRSVLETWGYGYMNFDPNVENNRGHELILEGSVEGVTFVKCDMFVCGIVCEIKRCEKYAVRYKIESSQRWGSGGRKKNLNKVDLCPKRQRIHKQTSQGTFKIQSLFTEAIPTHLWLLHRTTLMC